VVQNTCKAALIYLQLPSATSSSTLPVVSEWYQEVIMRRGFLFEPQPRPGYEKPRPWSISVSAVITIEMSVEHDHQVADEDDREHGCAMGGDTGGSWHGYTALNLAWYCSSVTFSIQSTALPSSAS
jgi:hypothetical protein